MAFEPLMTAISGWGPTWAPRQWTLCAGQLVSIAQYSAVFSLIGTIYGGDGRTTFRLPDLRARVPVAAGQSPGTSFVPQGALLGSESQVLTVLELPTHNHVASASLTVTHPASADPASEGTPGPTLVPAQIAQRGVTDLPNIYGTPDGTTMLAPGNVVGSVAIGNTGASESFSIVQPIQAIQYIFAMEGIFPSRN
ncbi:Microcystin-dependent protein [Tistlia consotensis]|uniref:Microcystin-dependent protein n=1 Tax=Tistlia consotensis USBA 355 TaxID=560819 RepID=A0A1Y6CS75_9PROT|nr:tail fiber protein [Tistlia consotensis]SMF72572.1 Microcystin-dependent protein [Tistlia consotensis USBA 355]SNS09412.1 Microcystin-dependent protein [Tistlia consotensis]